MANRSKSPANRGKRKVRTLAFPVEFRLRIVKLFLEEGYSARLLVKQFGISTHSVQRWVRAYRLHGEAGLAPKLQEIVGPRSVMSAGCGRTWPGRWTIVRHGMGSGPRNSIFTT
jgi:transposase